MFTHEHLRRAVHRGVVQRIGTPSQLIQKWVMTAPVRNSRHSVETLRHNVDESRANALHPRYVNVVRRERIHTT